MTRAKKALSPRQQDLMDFLRPHREGGIERCHIPDELLNNNTVKALEKKGLLTTSGVFKPSPKAYPEDKKKEEPKTRHKPGELLCHAGTMFLAFRDSPDSPGPCRVLYGRGPGADHFKKTSKALPHVVRHSPDGMNFGYVGSGPADLALSLLTFALGEPYASGFYQSFLREKLQTDGPTLGLLARDIAEWFADKSQHDWHKTVIRVGRDKGTDLPTRCRKCGDVRRRDGKNKPCTVAERERRS